MSIGDQSSSVKMRGGRTITIRVEREQYAQDGTFFRDDTHAIQWAFSVQYCIMDDSYPDIYDFTHFLDLESAKRYAERIMLLKEGVRSEILRWKYSPTEIQSEALDGSEFPCVVIRPLLYSEYYPADIYESVAGYCAAKFPEFCTPEGEPIFHFPDVISAFSREIALSRINIADEFRNIRISPDERPDFNNTVHVYKRFLTAYVPEDHVKSAIIYAIARFNDDRAKLPNGYLTRYVQLAVERWNSYQLHKKAAGALGKLEGDEKPEDATRRVRDDERDLWGDEE